ncbi:hypothetical protein HYH03_003667 [Edaphochlamys debaryana]|uniref:Peptidase S74 domain-containing protein n=1 Tax=Edaphochlamys debaryana TaxID=47281 RepID=A0A835Y9A2_9CHLO|nr:hypothetical protein HYH03_003667 [Edaphochlamys debaryana]|eukprot:KAG2498408.1 hypothetical protein HYH03_003667 [Edaphochlamys debaryana]
MSDARMKTDVQLISAALDKLQAISGYTFLRADQDSAQRYCGLLAQELQQVLPEAVYTDDRGNLSVAYGNTVPQSGQIKVSDVAAVFEVSGGALAFSSLYRAACGGP